MLAREHSMVHQVFFAVIVAIATTLAPIGWPNIDNVTCLLTPSVALPGSQYQETDKPLQGGRRCWKIPHCHHHNQFTSHHLYCPPRRRRRKRKTLALYLPMAKFLSRSHENLLRYQLSCCASIHSTSRSAPWQHPIARRPPLLPRFSFSSMTPKTEDPCPLPSNG
jgi:hypothetical protein